MKMSGIFSIEIESLQYHEDILMIRPLPINHRPIAINMQCNKIPFIDMNFFWGAFLLRQHFDREHFFRGAF